ncbi:MAG: cell wall metabolism sensor histidine kinase WalK, partial [Deltaproteobacteria bacterium]|nr:cell wall metabolism sensor histidine kinase WalK [Deltaproteobacteria bacterium]
IRLGAHYAMMTNSRDDIEQIINNISRQNDIVNIRIYNKEGEIKFSNRDDEIDSQTNIKAEACYICHRTEPPVVNIALYDRMRKFKSQEGTRLLGVISPVFNEPGCSTDACHVHPEDKKVLGALDLVVSLEKTEKEIIHHEKNLLGLSIFIFLFTSTMIGIFLFRFIKYPIERLIKGTRLIEKGNYKTDLEIHQTDEMGQLARAITHMGKAIGEKQ